MCLEKGVRACVPGSFGAGFLLHPSLYLPKLLLCTVLSFLAIHVLFLLFFPSQLLSLNMLTLFFPFCGRPVEAMHCISLCSLFTTVSTHTNARIHNSDTPEVVNVIGTIFMSRRLKISPLQVISH